MTELTELSMAGIEYRDPELDDAQPGDFAVVSDAASLVMLAFWWEADWNSLAREGLLWIGRPLVTAANGAWMVQDGVISVGPASDAAMQKRLNANRDTSDFSRDDYLSSLLVLRAEFPEFNMDEWIAAFSARPLRDALTDFRQQRTAERGMARVFIAGADGRVSDVLVLDDRGESAQAGDDAYLSRAAADFAAQGSDRPPLADYVNWLAAQQPHGGQMLVAPSVFRSGGFLPNVAVTQLSDRLGRF